MRVPFVSLSLTLLCFVACAATEGSSALHGADDSQAFVTPTQQLQVQKGAVLSATVDTNLRDGPSTRSRILRVVPAGSEVHIIGSSQAFAGFFSVIHEGIQGWMNGSYLTFVRAEAIVVPSGWTVPNGIDGSNTSIEEGTPDITTYDQPPLEADPEPAPDATRRDQALERAATGVGYSYWWGGGRWDPTGVSSATAGVCTGYCPNCEHSGAYGADCSGFVSKVWQVPAGNSDPMNANHGYSTVVYMNQTYSWTNIERGALEKADALVYNANGSGHIVLYEKGDAWGSLWTFESRACAIGIVHNLRTVANTYKGIRRNGY